MTIAEFPSVTAGFLHAVDGLVHGPARAAREKPPRKDGESPARRRALRKDRAWPPDGCEASLRGDGKYRLPPPHFRPQGRRGGRCRGRKTLPHRHQHALPGRTEQSRRAAPCGIHEWIRKSQSRVTDIAL